MKIEVPSSGPVQGAGAIHRYGLNPGDFAIIQRMLSRGLYSDPVRAAIQELGSNARDAQIENGNPEVPIQIALPTQDDPALYIIDHGVGINEDRMINVFGKLAASTKRDDDVQLGGFGLGSKTAYAISDTFTIDTVAVDLDGVKRKRTWLHYKEDGLNSFTEFSSEDSEEPTGTTIKIPIPDWEEKFEHMWRSAFSIFRYWGVKPIIRNAPDEAQWEQLETKFQGDNWRLERKSGQDDSKDTTEAGITIIVGGIPYDLDKSQLTRIGITYTGYYRLVFPFEIGEIQVLPTRESIDYEASTPALVHRWRFYYEQIERVVNTSQEENLMSILQVARGIGLDSISWRGRLVDVKDLGDVWVSKWIHERIKCYRINLSEESFAKEKTETVRFSKVYYTKSKTVSKHRLDFAFGRGDGKRTQLMCFDGEDAFREFVRLHAAFPELAAPLPITPPQKRKPADFNQVFIFNGKSKPTKAKLDITKLKGYYGFVCGRKLVDERGFRIHKNINETVYGLCSWWKKHVSELPKSAVSYRHAEQVRRKRDELRAKCAKTKAHRKYGFNLVLGDNREEQAQILLLLRHPPFRLIRDRIRKLAVPVDAGNCDHTLHLDRLMRLAYKGHMPSFLTGNCDFKDTKLLFNLLKKLDYNTLTWQDFKTHHHIT